MASFMWTMLCPPESLWLSKQHVLPSVPWDVCVCDALIGQAGGLYNFRLLNVQTRIPAPALLSHSIFHIFIGQETCGTWLFPDRKCTLLSTAVVRFLSLQTSFHTRRLFTYETHTAELVTTVTARQLWGHGPVWPPPFVLTHCSCPWAGCYL